MDPEHLMEFFLTSSSSSSENDVKEVLRAILPELLHHNHKKELYAEVTVPLYTDAEFRNHFKVPKTVLSNLVIEHSQSEYYAQRDTGFQRVSAEKCMWVWCWYATHEAASFRDVADRFDIALSTLHLIIENVTTFLSYKSNSVIMWLKREEQEQTAEDFKEIGFPDVIGCMDGTYIRIDKPETDPDSYLNRKKYYSIQIQAVCDSKKRIRDIFLGYPGSVHDARVFRNSPLFQQLSEKCGNRYILADSAYPCLRNMLTPYRDNGNLTAIERNYNTILSHSRIFIEHTFGILKQKFSQLYHLKLRNISSICHFIRACCVVHNLSYEIDQHMDDNEEGETGEDYNLPDIDMEDDEVEGNVLGQNFRNYIAALLFN